MAKLEDFSPGNQTADATAAFQDELFTSTIGRRLFTVAPAGGDAAAFQRPADAPQIPPGIDAASWTQVSQWVADNKTVNFVPPAEGQVADYILGEDGKLVKNPAKTSPSPDGSITVEVQNTAGLEAAKQAAQQLQVAAVQEKIFYWQKANPGSTDIPEYLKGMLSAAQNVSGFEPKAQPQVERQPQPQPQQEVSAPQPAPMPMGGGGGGGGGGSGLGGERIGNSQIGQAPSGGFRDGGFEPNRPIDRTAIPKPVEGDLAIKGEPSCTVDQIQTFLEKMGSPAAQEKGFSQALYTACTERGIDPAVAVGFFLQESTCGRYGRAKDNLSLGNIKGRAPESGGTDGTFRKYDSWAEGARDWARLIDESYVQKRGLTSLSQVIGVYAPSSDGNNESRYVATVKGVVENFKKQNNGTAVA